MLLRNAHREYMRISLEFFDEWKGEIHPLVDEIVELQEFEMKKYLMETLGIAERNLGVSEMVDCDATAELSTALREAFMFDLPDVGGDGTRRIMVTTFPNLPYAGEDREMRNEYIYGMADLMTAMRSVGIEALVLVVETQASLLARRDRHGNLLTPSQSALNGDPNLVNTWCHNWVCFS